MSDTRGRKRIVIPEEVWEIAMGQASKNEMYLGEYISFIVMSYHKKELPVIKF